MIRCSQIALGKSILTSPPGQLECSTLVGVETTLHDTVEHCKPIYDRVVQAAKLLGNGYH